MGRFTKAIATCRVLPDGELPEWVELLPPGRDIVGADGRRFTLEDPAAVVAAFASRPVDVVVDWEHASELLAPDGHPAPAAGWIRELQVRDGGAIWGRIDWTPRGAESVRSREYRYHSPAFIHTPDGHVLKIVSVGLTNQPNLDLPALNRAGSQEDTRMDPKLLEALGLPATATNADVLAALAKMQGDLQTAKNRAEAPSLEKFVPRPDYEAAMHRASTAETKLAAREKADQEREIEQLIAEASAAGKITPATTDFYRAQCRQAGGIAAFRDFVTKAPKVADATLPPKPADASGASELTEVQRAICRNLGVAEDKFKKTV